MPKARKGLNPFRAFAGVFDAPRKLTDRLSTRDEGCNRVVMNGHVVADRESLIRRRCACRWLRWWGTHFSPGVVARYVKKVPGCTLCMSEQHVAAGRS